ncbi:cold-shock protein [Paracoccus fontiphilus]|uniref:Cold-shock protein n=1 Tax=Paracoccus fontiphilus TaxID=1815556 RepID=A0ABV7IA65_9RHOB|nr:cold shock domain-containing protein [Paracoccus fontiphilus]
MTEEKGSKLVSGLVKWFDPAKGYGFILNEEGGADILLHANVLRNFGRSSVADQSRVTVWMQPTQRGLQATEVVSIEPPLSEGAPIADLDNGVIEQLETLPLRPARVKWFDKAKGFGFANIFGYPDDVFLHVEVLRHSGFADLIIGEAIGVRVVEGPRGLMAAQVTSWDRGTEQGAPSLRPCGLGDQAQDVKDFLTHVAE